MLQETEIGPVETASDVDELAAEDFEKLFGDKPLTITDSEVVD
ncbi:hypothetical protein AB0F59_13620 [Micromonospora lupini]